MTFFTSNANRNMKDEREADHVSEFLQLQWAVKAGVAARQDVDNFRREHADWLLQPENQEYLQAVSGFLGEFPAPSVPQNVNTHPPPLVVEKRAPYPKAVKPGVTPRQIKLGRADMEENRMRARDAANLLDRKLGSLSPTKKLKVINPILTQWIQAEAVGSPEWQSLWDLNHALNMSGEGDVVGSQIFENMEANFRKLYIDKTQKKGDLRNAWIRD